MDSCYCNYDVCYIVHCFILSYFMAIYYSTALTSQTSKSFKFPCNRLISIWSWLTFEYCSGVLVHCRLDRPNLSLGATSMVAYWIDVLKFCRVPELAS